MAHKPWGPSVVFLSFWTEKSGHHKTTLTHRCRASPWPQPQYTRFKTYADVFCIIGICHFCATQLLLADPDRTQVSSSAATFHFPSFWWTGIYRLLANACISSDMSALKWFQGKINMQEWPSHDLLGLKSVQNCCKNEWKNILQVITDRC